MNPLSKQAIKNQLTGALISGVLTAIFMYLLFFRGWQSLAAGICIGFFVYLGIAAYSNKIEKRYFMLPPNEIKFYHKKFNNNFQK